MIQIFRFRLLNIKKLLNINRCLSESTSKLRNELITEGGHTINTEKKDSNSLEIIKSNLEDQFKYSQSHWNLEVVLPNDLIEALTEYQEGYNRDQLKSIWTEYCNKNTSSSKSYLKWAEPFLISDDKPQTQNIFTESLTNSYIHCNFIQSFSIIKRVLEDSNKMLSNFSPKTMLDFGAGAGAGLWASYIVYPNLKEYSAVDTSVFMNEAAKKICSKIPIHKQHWSDLLSLFRKNVNYDLILCSDIIGELPTGASKKTALALLYEHLSPNGLLVLIEPGSRIGFHTITQSRDLLLNVADQATDTKIRPVAPCTHCFNCPLLGQNRLCNFIQKCKPPIGFNNPRKAATKFTYFSCLKGPKNKKGEVDNKNRNRVIGHVLKRSRHLIIDYCGNNGLFERKIITKGKSTNEYYHNLNIFFNFQKEHFIKPEKSDWGGIVPNIK